MSCFTGLFSPMTRFRRSSKVFGSLAVFLETFSDQIQKFIYRQSDGLRFGGVKVTESLCPRSALGVSSSVPVVLESLSHSIVIFDHEKGVFSLHR